MSVNRDHQFLELQNNWSISSKLRVPHPFLRSFQKLDGTDDRQMPSIFWKISKMGHRMMDRPRPFFGTSQKLDGTDDRQTLSIFWTLAYIIGQPSDK